ncbi:MAG: MFS transporter [Candidatus Cloacimonetes bacterium]|nr:MFS transporter [Candidatus Cloacimonadota bacterium]
MTKTPNPPMIRKTLRISIIEGIFAQVYGTLSAIGSSFITKLLIMLQATPMHFSLLSAIGQISAVFQPIGIALTYKLSHRKRACIAVSAVGRFLTFFLGLSFRFVLPEQGIWFVLILLFFSATLSSIGGNIWIAWISNIVPLNFRGRFFAKRNQYLLIAGLLAGYIVSFTVGLFDIELKGLQLLFMNATGLRHLFQPEKQGLFISWVFVVATALSLLGLFILSKQPEKPAIIRTESLRQIYLKPFKDKNFRKLLLYGVWWMLSIGIGSAFWGPFMLQKLNMTLFDMQIYGSIHVFASLMSFKFWGRFIDFNGNKTAMKICIIISGINPLLWLFMTADHHAVIWVEALISGFMWAGAGIVSTNFVLSIAPKNHEQVYSGIYGAFSGFGMMFTTLLTGILFPKSITIGGLFLEPEQVIFGIGGVLRWTTLIPLAFVVEAKSKSLKSVGMNLRDTLTRLLRNIKIKDR